MNEVKVVSNNGNLIATYEVGINPGDFAFWQDNELSTSTWVFVANEGNYGASNGSISMIDKLGNVTTIEEIGDVVQSLAVHKNKLIVIINNSHKIKFYDISEDGLSLPGIEVSTENSSPREMVIIDDKVYFTNWNTQDVKVLNLFNYSIEESIPTGELPEGILSDGSNIWVANSGSNNVTKIDINSNTVESIEVGDGPQSLINHNGDVFISRRYYDASWNAFHGTSKIILD
jgi:YVTN family beta-propeller protein